MIDQGECRSIEDFFKDRKGMMYKINERKERMVVWRNFLFFLLLFLIHRLKDYIHFWITRNGKRSLNHLETFGCLNIELEIVKLYISV